MPDSFVSKHDAVNALNQLAASSGRTLEEMAHMRGVSVDQMISGFHTQLSNSVEESGLS